MLSIDFRILLGSIYNFFVYIQFYACYRQLKHLAIKIKAFPSVKHRNERNFLRHMQSERKKLYRYLLLLLLRLFFLNCTLLVVDFKTLFSKYDDSKRAMLFISLIIGSYTLFTLPMLIKKLLASQRSSGEYLKNAVFVVFSFLSVVLCKMLIKFALVVSFVLLAQFVIQFLAFNVLIVVLLKVCGAAFLRWEMKDSRYAAITDDAFRKPLLEYTARYGDRLPFDRIFVTNERLIDEDDPVEDATLVMPRNVLLYIYGFLRTKMLLISGICLRALHPKELLALVSNQYWHWRSEDNLARYLSFYAQNFFAFWLIRVVFQRDFQVFFGFPPHSLYAKLVISLPFVPLFYRISDTLINVFAMRQTFAADRWTAQEGKGRDLVSALQKMYVHAGLCPSQDLFYAILNCSQMYPPLDLRCDKIDRQLEADTLGK